jgi:hypothetical protein
MKAPANIYGGGGGGFYANFAYQKNIAIHILNG